MAMRALVFAVVFGVLAFAHAGVWAHGYKQHDVSIGHIWAPPSEGGAISIYGPLLNNGAAEDRLVSVESSLPGAVVSLEAEGDDGAVAVQGDIALAPGVPVSLAAWGVHIVLRGLEQPVKAGENFPLTLVFEKAGAITVEVVVEDEASGPH